MPASIQWCQGLVKNGPPEIGPSCDNNKPTVAATGIEKFKKAESAADCAVGTEALKCKIREQFH